MDSRPATQITSQASASRTPRETAAAAAGDSFHCCKISICCSDKLTKGEAVCKCVSSNKTIKENSWLGLDGNKSCTERCTGGKCCKEGNQKGCCMDDQTPENGIDEDKECCKKGCCGCNFSRNRNKECCKEGCSNCSCCTDGKEECCKKDCACKRCCSSGNKKGCKEGLNGCACCTAETKKEIRGDPSTKSDSCCTVSVSSSGTANDENKKEICGDPLGKPSSSSCKSDGHGRSGINVNQSKSCSKECVHKNGGKKLCFCPATVTTCCVRHCKGACIKEGCCKPSSTSYRQSNCSSCCDIDSCYTDKLAKGQYAVCKCISKKGNDSIECYKKGYADCRCCADAHKKCNKEECVDFSCSKNENKECCKKGYYDCSGCTDENEKCCKEDCAFKSCCSIGNKKCWKERITCCTCCTDGISSPGVSHSEKKTKICSESTKSLGCCTVGTSSTALCNTENKKEIIQGDQSVKSGRCCKSDGFVCGGVKGSFGDALERKLCCCSAVGKTCCVIPQERTCIKNECKCCKPKAVSFSKSNCSYCDVASCCRELKKGRYECKCISEIGNHDRECCKNGCAYCRCCADEDNKCTMKRCVHCTCSKNENREWCKNGSTDCRCCADEGNKCTKKGCICCSNQSKDCCKEVYSDCRCCTDEKEECCKTGCACKRCCSIGNKKCCKEELTDCSCRP